MGRILYSFSLLLVLLISCTLGCTQDAPQDTTDAPPDTLSIPEIIIEKPNFQTSNLRTLLDEDLKGQVKSVCTFSFENHDSTQGLTTCQYFSSKGILTHKTVYDLEDQLLEKYEYLIADSTLETRVLHKRWGQLDTHWVTYNQQGNFTHAYHKVKRDEIYEQTVKYNQWGKRSEYIKYDEKGRIQKKHLHEYDSLGNEIKETEFNSRGQVVETSYFYWDERGNFLGYEDQKGNGTQIRKIEYHYDNADNRVKEAEFGTGNKPYRVKNTSCDSLNHEIAAKVYNSKGELESETYLEYDSLGNKISTTTSLYFQGALAQKDETGYYRNGATAWTRRYQPNDQGRPELVKSWNYDSTGHQEVTPPFLFNILDTTTLKPYIETAYFSHLISRDSLFQGPEEQWSYDSQGHPTQYENTSQELNGVIVTFDSLGNWLTAKAWEHPWYYEYKREIQYYD